ncbi:MAG: c-type cytochrome [Planctomycetota bacterium]|jgi:mono/diheme cytochrome c family protein
MVDRKDESLDQDTEATDVQELHGPILRERGDPREGYEPVPMWFTALCGALVFWAGWYMSEFGGGGSPAVLDPRPEMRFPGGAGETKQIDPAALGKKLFTAQCVSCHQQSGMGVPDQYPPLVGSRWVTDHPARIKRILLHGLKGPITVSGKSYNGNMPAFGARMKDEHIAAILTYVRTAWGNAAEPIAAESVAATRAATADRRGEWTAAELEAVTEDDAPPEESK